MVPSCSEFLFLCYTSGIKIPHFYHSLKASSPSPYELSKPELENPCPCSTIVKTNI
ncbi:hypothetical protein Bca101_019461 [Brassica carinata]